MLLNIGIFHVSFAKKGRKRGGSRIMLISHAEPDIDIGVIVYETREDVKEEKRVLRSIKKQKRRWKVMRKRFKFHSVSENSLIAELRECREMIMISDLRC